MLHFTGKSEGKREADLVLTFVKNVSESATSLVTPKGRDETKINFCNKLIT